jgi:ligand-binding sensor domain-containing protein/serine phosphatase RsbU (regulator of sigma subunit)
MRRGPIILFLVFIHLCIALPGLVGQIPYLKQHTLIKGRRDYNTQVIFQDQQGYIWFGTTDGLIRFDGEDYRLFTVSDSLADNHVTAMTQDARGVIWIGHENGSISLFDGMRFTAFDPESGLGAIPVTDILFDRSGVLWFTTMGEGVYYYRENRMYNINMDDGLSDDYAYCLETGTGDDIWVGTDYGINIVSAGSDNIVHISMRDGLPDNIVKDISRMDSSTYMIATDEEGMVRYHAHNGTFDLFENWEFGSINNISRQEDDYWVSTARNGVIHLVLREDGSYMYESLTRAQGLPADRTEVVFIDREGNVWIGNGNGVTQAITPIFEFLGSNQNLPFQMVYSFLIDTNDYYWICSETGLYRLQPSQSGGFLVDRMFGDGPYGSVPFISLYEDAEQFIWAGSYDYGVFRINPVTLEYKRYSTDNGLADNNVISISGSGNKVHFSTLGGGISICTIDKEPFRFVNYSEGNRISNNYVYSTFTDSKNRIWVAEAGNTISVLDDTATISYSEKDSIFTSAIYYFTEDNSHNIWFTTENNGIYCYDGREFINYNEDNGLRNIEVKSIILDRYQNLVLVSNDGIDLYHPGRKAFTRFSENYGVAYMEPILNSIYKDREDNIWIGTNNGLIKYNPEQIFRDTIGPRIFISGKWGLIDPIPAGKARFRHNENHFRFVWTGLWYQAPDQLRYRLRLEGYDLNWSSTTTTREREYSRIPPGTYTFRVEVSTDNSTWIGSDEASYAFTVTPPFWQRLWFILLSIVSILIVIYAIFRYRLAALRRAKERLEEEVRKATKEIREKNEELEAQKNEIEAQRDLVMEQRDQIALQQQELQSSIRYAHRIQTAVLTPDSEVKRLLKDCFILNMPRDIVSGDFYWVAEKDGSVFFAVADSTGHGVPGAFMSMLGVSAFNQVLGTDCGTQANNFLFELREMVKTALHLTAGDQETADGMDAAMCIYNRNTRRLSFAGANNPIYLVRDGELTEFKCDKMPIGLHYRDGEPFIEQAMDINKGDCIYLFSDGYADQFGGESGKKFKYKPFKEKLKEVHSLPMEEQKKVLEETILKWKGDYEQIDDIMVMGVRFRG